MLRQRCAGASANTGGTHRAVDSHMNHNVRQPQPSRTRQAGRRQAANVRAAATVEFAKYQGLGNDFILVGEMGPCFSFPGPIAAAVHMSFTTA